MEINTHLQTLYLQEANGSHPDYYKPKKFADALKSNKTLQVLEGIYDVNIVKILAHNKASYQQNKNSGNQEEEEKKEENYNFNQQGNYSNNLFGNASFFPNNFNDRKNDKIFHLLLKFVVAGEQDILEEIIKVTINKYPNLLLEKGRVSDLSKRTFKNISIFQYALWALDTHMWRMLRKYMSDSDVKMQMDELNSKGASYTYKGKEYVTTDASHFIKDVSDQLEQYVNMYYKSFIGQENYKTSFRRYFINYDSASDIKKMKAHWQKGVREAQMQLPVHAVNQYCSRECSSASVETLRRSRRLHDDDVDWFQVKKGKAWDYACARELGRVPTPAKISGIAGPNGETGDVYKSYSFFMESMMNELLKIRSNELSALKLELSENSKESQDAHIGLQL